MIMDISIILYEPYPTGYAATNRIHLYAKGINEHGEMPSIYIPRPTEMEASTSLNDKCKGVFDSIPFEYTCGRTIRSKIFFVRRWVNLRGVLVTAYKLFKKRKTSNAVLIVNSSALPLLFFALVTKILKMRYIIEKSELPFFNKPAISLRDKIFQFFHKEYIYKIFDGVIVISQPLYDFFKNRVKKSARLLLVPIIVNPEEFNCKKSDCQAKTITYCGNFTDSQDGIFTIIRAFSLVKNTHKNVRLNLIGRPRNSIEENSLLGLISKLNLQKNISMLGYIPKSELQSYLCNSNVLVLAKPNNLQTEYCFPTKLGEYLATGNPVVVTEVGAIKNYLKDGENAYLSAPENPQNFADKLIEALTSDTKTEVGKNGYLTVMEHFDYRIHIENILNLLTEPNSNNNLCKGH